MNVDLGAKSAGLSTTRSLSGVDLIAAASDKLIELTFRCRSSAAGAGWDRTLGLFIVPGNLCGCFEANG